MDLVKQWRLPLAFAASFFGVGVPYWSIPYRLVNLPDALMTPTILVVILSALLLRASAAAPFWMAASIVGSSVPAAVLARVIVDGLNDPTSHNLWPVEFVIALLVGFVCALVGTVAGSLTVALIQNFGRSRD